MTVKEIVKAIGGDAEVARRLGIRPVSVRGYMRDGYLPRKHHAVILDMAASAGLRITTLDLDPSAPTPGNP